MAVTVLLPGVLRAIADGQAKLELDAPVPATLAGVLDVVAERYPGLGRRLRDENRALRRYVNFYVDGEECRYLGGADAPVAADAEIQVIPSVAGG
ncbi:FIG038648: MoaD and/or ThiS families [Alloactinosynnema sp. L-07]|uniref:MoaD/ThiS family protein n=1 Tax=Alloactinosynnema sp. L-07 TaxID=1653480 RepID=UPI00065EFD53|nr:MoaD/ThiS family protein [Alloactinosynnema sp. L-07]CRK58902.1 FIG038648: MoaD and/or ThiS families [Alloactinosynnema sp. L-07]